MPLSTDVLDQIRPPKPRDADKMLNQFFIYIRPDSLIGSSQQYFNDVSGVGERYYIFFAELPRNLTVNKDAVYSDDVIQGRTEPWKNYSHTAPTRISFNAKLYAQGKKKTGLPVNSFLGKSLGLAARFIPSASPFLGIGGNLASGLLNTDDDENEWPLIIFEEVHQRLNRLEACTHAQYDQQGRAYPPPVVSLNVGRTLFRRGIIKSVTWTYEGPWETQNVMAYGADVRIIFEEVNSRPNGFYDVADRGALLLAGDGPESFVSKAAQSLADQVLSTIGL